jgi:putative Mg2+ transporter-C (MgtC) family protein
MNAWVTTAAGGWSGAWQVVCEEFSDLPELAQVVRIVLRLLVAVVLGGVVGLERQLEGKPAGLRTHMLVALGAALFVLVPRMAGMSDADVSRVIQGTLAGIGFIGGGTILKMRDEHIVHGVTTAASVWVAAGVGIAAGLGRLWSAVAASAITFCILAFLGRFEHQLIRKTGVPPPPESTGNDTPAQ